MKKELKQMVKALEAQGFQVEITRRQHVMVYREGRLITTFSGTASDWRAMRNALSHARRAGFRWPP